MAMTLLDYSGTASFLLGCIMASNTLIAYPIVGRYGLQRHPSVTLSVGSSMISLFMALVMLAALAGSYEENNSWLFWPLFILKFAVFCLVSIIFIPKLTRYFLRRYSDAVMQYIFVLAIMFLSAAFTSLIGLEGIFGAFFSGLILNRYIPRVSPLMNRIEFIGNALFIPYFLIGVGMLINIRTIFAGPEMLWIVFLIVFFGTFGKALAAYVSSLLFRLTQADGGKALAAYVSSLLFRLTQADGHMMFGLTSAHAAGAIAMVMVGMRLEVAPGVYLINDIMLNGIIMMILFTCIISTLMTQHAAKQIILQERAHLQTDTPKVDDEKILLCVKYPEIAPQLLDLAMLIRNHRLKRELVALNVVYDGQNSTQDRVKGIQLRKCFRHQGRDPGTSGDKHRQWHQACLPGVWLFGNHHGYARTYRHQSAFLGRVHSESLQRSQPSDLPHPLHATNVHLAPHTGGRTFSGRV